MNKIPCVLVMCISTEYDTEGLKKNTFKKSKTMLKIFKFYPYIFLKLLAF